MNQNERQSNFELMRIIAMLMIIMGHYTGFGIIHYNTEYLNDVAPIFNKIIVPAINAGGSIAVGLFFMITGFFLCKKNNNPKFLQVLVETCFYAIIIVLLYIINSVLKGEKISLQFIFSFLIIPISSNQWWFVTTYLILMFMVPYLNNFIKELDRKQLLHFIIIALCIWQTLGFIDIKYKINSYYDLQRALCFYFIGAYISLYIKKTQRKTFFLLLAIYGWIFYAITKYLFVSLEIHNPFLLITTGIGRTLLKGWIEPFIAISIFMFFYNIDIKSNYLINNISATVFGIYLLHENNFIRNILWNGIFKAYEKYKSPLLIIYIFVSSLIIFIVCSFIDYLRIKIIEPHLYGYIKYKCRNLIGE